MSFELKKREFVCVESICVHACMHVYICSLMHLS